MKEYLDSQMRRHQERASRGSIVPRRESTSHENRGLPVLTSDAYGTQPMGVPQRPQFPPRTNSIGGPLLGPDPGSPTSTIGSPPWRDSRSHSYSTTDSTQSRRPSDVAGAMGVNSITRTMSATSAESTEFGVHGGFDWQYDSDDFGTNGSYGWKSDPRGPSSRVGRRR